MNLLELNTDIVKEIVTALKTINYGSVEIIVQDGEITQISTRNIKKTNLTKKPISVRSGNPSL